MKIEAGGFEGKPAMIQQAADVRFRVANQVLVLNMQHFAGQDGIPIAFGIWFCVAIWVIYRVIRGYLLFKDSKPIPGI